MNHLIFPVLAGLVFACAQSVAQPPEYTERISKEFALPNGAAASTLVIYNVNGFVKVEGAATDKVTLDVEKRLMAKTQDVLEVGKKEFKLVFEQKGDTIIAYIAEPFDSRPNRDDRRVNYDFTLDFTVKVPREITVRVSTVNRGDVTVRDVAGALQVRNVNGAIALNNVRGATDAHTINGNVDANYLVGPPDASAYYTLNGNIRINYPADLSADLQFKTFQGAFYTDFSDAQILPVQVVKTQENRGDKTVYKLNKTTAIRVGAGGKILRFETFNGNVYIKN